MQLDPLTRRLGQAVLLGAGLTGCFGLFVHRQVKRRYQERDFYQKAMDILLTNKHAKQFLGEPIKFQPFRSDIFSDKTLTKISVPAVGPTSQGVLYFEAVKDESGRENLTSVEFELERPKGRMKLL